jgi:TonB family protein
MKKLLLFAPVFILILLPAQLKAQNGIVKTYYDDGSIESEIAYVNDILDGLSVFYFPNGNIREEIPFSYGKVSGVRRKYYTNGLIKEEIHLADGLLDGLTKKFYENGGLKEAINYEAGKLLKKIDVPFDSTYAAPLEDYLAGNRQYKLSKEADIVSDAEICPVPVNGIKDIQNNLVIPKDTGNDLLSGVVTLSVKVDTLGNAAGAEIIKGLRKDYDDAAKIAVEKTKFLPGKKGNRPVDAKVVLNVEFKNEQKLASLQLNEQKAKEIIPVQVPVPIPLEREKPLVKEEIKQVAKKEIAAEPVKQLEKKEEPVKKAIIVQNAVAIKVSDTVPEENTPFPVGGIERILARMKVSQKIIDSKTEGDVVFRVEVDKYGVVRNTKLIKGLATGIDEAVEVAILDSPFKPAKIDGKPVSGEVELKIPIIFNK